MAVIVAVMTAFYTFRMIGMAFLVRESKHLEQMQHEGHHLHEVGKIMWVPFGILGNCDYSYRPDWLCFEEQLQHIFGEYLAHSFGIGEEGPEGRNAVDSRAGWSISRSQWNSRNSISWRIQRRRYTWILVLHC